MYENIKSKFVKNKLKGLKYNKDNKDYIDTLMYLEKYVSGESGGWATSIKIHHLKGQYKTEYESIFSELKPEEFKAQKKKEERAEKRWKDEKVLDERRDKKEEEESKKSWKDMGGKL